MTTETTPEEVGDLGGRAERDIELRPSGRDRLEALGLLVGMAAVLLVLALIFGAAPAIVR
jgi:hypothetical protein